MRQNTTGRQPDVVDIESYQGGYSHYATWLDDNKVTICKSVKSFTSSSKQLRAVKQYTLTSRGGYLRFMSTLRGRISESSRPIVVSCSVSGLPRPVQLLVSGHMFNEFLHGDDFVMRVLADMWPMLPLDEEYLAYHGSYKVNPAFRQNEPDEFLSRLVGFSSYPLAEFVDRYRRDLDMVNILRSVPVPQTPYDYRDLLDVLEHRPRWRHATDNTKKIAFDHAMQIIKQGMPAAKYNYGTLDLTGHGSLQSAVDAKNKSRWQWVGNWTVSSSGTNSFTSSNLTTTTIPATVI